MPVPIRQTKAQGSPYDQRPVTKALTQSNDQGKPSAYKSGIPAGDTATDPNMDAMRRRLLQSGPENAYTKKQDKYISGKSSDGKKMPDYIGSK